MKWQQIAAAISLFFFTQSVAFASTTPYVKPESLWPFRAFEGLMLVLGFFAAYRTIRSHLPPGDDVAVEKTGELKEPIPSKESEPPHREQSKTANHQVLSALRIAGLIFMVAGSFLGFHTGGIDYGPAHLDELTTRIFGGALFLVGLSDFFLLPKLIAGKSSRDRL